MFNKIRMEFLTELKLENKSKKTTNNVIGMTTESLLFACCWSLNWPPHV